MHPDRPLPSPNPGTAPYWKAAREHKLVLPRCSSCGKFHSYPRALCPFCSSSQLEWQQCSGRGVIYSFTEVFRAPSKGFAEDVPYIVAIVALDEGPHLMTRLPNADKDKVKIDARVMVDFEDIDDETALPLFRISAQ